jgi:hypothetical protein
MRHLNAPQSTFEVHRPTPDGKKTPIPRIQSLGYGRQTTARNITTEHFNKTSIEKYCKFACPAKATIIPYLIDMQEVRRTMTLKSRSKKTRILAETEESLTSNETETQSKRWKAYKRKAVSHFNAELRQKEEAEVKEFEQVVDPDQERKEDDPSQRPI